MAIITKDNKIIWQLKDSTSLIASAILFIPFPIHAFVFAFIVRGFKARVSSQIIIGIIFGCIELSVAILFARLGSKKGYTSTSSQQIVDGIYWTTVILSYVVAMVILLGQTIKYLNRRTEVKMEGADWVSRFTPKEKKINKVVVPERALTNSELFIQKLTNLKYEIENTSIQENVDKMIYLFKIIDQKDKVAAEKFLITHNTVVNVLTQYDNIENSRLNNETAIQSKKHLESVIEKATIAFEQELTNQFKTEIMEVSAETDAYLQQLRNKNLL